MVAFIVLGAVYLEKLYKREYVTKQIFFCVRNKSGNPPVFSGDYFT
jgi:hypothetical protein